jgi:hypothetical protein
MGAASGLPSFVTGPGFVGATDSLLVSVFSDPAFSFRAGGVAAVSGRRPSALAFSLAAAFSAAWVRTMSEGSRAREIWPTGEGCATWLGRSQMEALPSVPPIRAPEKNSTAAANRRRPALDVCESRSLMFDASVIGQSCTRAARDNLGLRKVSPAPAAQAREVQMTALVLALSRH